MKANYREQKVTENIFSKVTIYEKWVMQDDRST